jgi:phenylpropionate dioxygenase-like ring-hydroxylating dioxygenase large terminal subunit
MGSRQDLGLRKLVDLDKGLVAREIYVNEEIFERELEQVYGRAWLFVGHESQIPNPGDFVVSRMGTEEVLLVRDRKHKIHVHLNTCRHRGMKVCRYDEGNALVFTCPFHGWSYDTDGRLVGVPYIKTAYKDGLDKSQFGLHEVAQMANYYGSIWATWDPKAPPFETYLGPYADTVRRCFEATDGTDAGVELFNPVYKWRIPCNWKFPAVSFDGDRAHAAMTHRSISVAAIGPQGDAAGNGSRHMLLSEWSQTNYEMSVPDLGHGGHNSIYDQAGVAPYRDTWLTEPGVDEYYRATNEKRRAKYRDTVVLGGEKLLVWPNTNVQAGMMSRILIWHPHSVGVTESWRLYQVDRDAPQHVKDAQRRYMMRYGGPCGMTESDDMENWNYAYAASSGTIAKRLPYNFQMGLGRAFEDDRAPGMVLNFDIAEENQRTRLKRWLDFMEADSWDELAPYVEDRT